MKIIKYILISITTIITLLIVVPSIVFAVLHYWILTPEYLTTKTKEAIKQYTYIDFDCKSIELDYLNSWPSLSLAINEGSVGLPNEKDSTITNGNLSFKKLYGNIQLKKLLSERKIQIQGITLEDPTAELSLGKRMPFIIKKDTNLTKKASSNVDFSIKQINITNANININKKKNNQNFEIRNASLAIKGELTGNEPSFIIKADCKEIGGHTITKLLGKEISFHLEGECKGTDKFNNITLNNASFQINQFPFELKGNIMDINKKYFTSADLSFNLLASELKEIMDFIPQQILPERTDYIVTGNTTLKGTIKGNISGKELPNLKLSCQIDKGSLYKKNINKGIDTISLNLDMSYLKDCADSCYISLKNAKIKGLNSNIEIESQITNLQQAPFITADFKGSVDFDHIGKEFVSPETVQLSGKVDSDLSVAFNWKDLKDKNLNKIWISGMFNAPHVKVLSPKHHVDVFISNSEASIGYKKNKSNFIKNDEVLSAHIEVDTLKMQYDKFIYLNLSKLKLRSNTALVKGKKEETPITTHINCTKLQAQLNANRWISTEGVTIHAGSKSAVISPKSAAACIVKADKLQYIDNKEQNVVLLKESEFITELHPGINNKWDIKGLINFQNSQIYTSYYPIDIRTQNTRLSFKNNQLSLNNTLVKVGESDCILSGILTVNNHPKPNEPKVEGTIHALADYINYNELKETLYYSEAVQKEFKNSNMLNYQQHDLNKILENAKKSSVKEKAFLIPKGLELDINLNINNMSYEEVALEHVNGEVFIKNQKVYTNLSTRSNLGEIALKALYDSKSKENINIKFDLDLKNILVTQIHNTIPTVRTLFPMIQSMDGLIDCHLTVSSQLDNQMFPIISTTEAACSLRGNNLTLFDNEVYRNIADKLLFKNKNKNNIDYLSTNIILKNDVIEVIPFQIQWDRYEAVAGGTHTTDQKFNYHISLLKRPISPIDFGVNLSGTIDDLHYKIVKCKFKDLYKDGGAEHNKKTKERLDKIRKEITKHIVL